MTPAAAARKRDTRVIGLIGSAHFFSHFFQLVLPPLYPLIHAAEGYSYTELGLLMSVFYAASGLCQTPAGFAVDRIGARPILFAGLGLLALAILLCGVFTSYPALLVLAVAAGIGNSVFHPTDFSILSATVDESRMGRAFSIHAFAGLAGYGAAPISMVTIAGLAGWKTAAIAAGAVGLLFLIVLAAMSAGFRDSADAAAARPVAQTGGGAVLLLRLPIIMFFLFFIVIAMAQIGVQTFGPTALIAMYDTELAMANGAVIAFLVALPIGVLIGGELADRTRRHNLIAVVCVAAPAVLIVFAGLASLGDIARISLFAASGAVFGALFPSRDLLVRSMAPQESSGKVFGFIYSGLDAGSALTPVTFGWLIDHGMAPWTFIIIGLCFVLSMATLLVTARVEPVAARTGAE